jgi:hypothetical protein
VTQVAGYASASQRTNLPVTEGELDKHLRRAVRRTSFMRQGFYVVVLLVALAGQVSGAVETLHIPVLWALPAVGALELGGIVVLANSDVRRRLGERAIASRLLSAAVAAAAVAFNWLAHADHLLGGFFAGMSALGYLVWLMHTENQRRDRLRTKGDLPPTTPAYEIIDHWLRHPLLTRRAKTLAKANPRLGLYESLAAARDEIRRERRHTAISKVLHRKIRAAVDPTTADIAVAVYDLDEIAKRLAGGADYDGLTSLIAADLAPTRIAADPAQATWWEQRQLDAAPASEPGEPTVDAIRVLPPALRRDIEDWLTRARQAATPELPAGDSAGATSTDAAARSVPPAAEPADTAATGSSAADAGVEAPERRAAAGTGAGFDPSPKVGAGSNANGSRPNGSRASGASGTVAPANAASANGSAVNGPSANGSSSTPANRSSRNGSAAPVAGVPLDAPPLSAEAAAGVPAGSTPAGGREVSLRKRVHAALDMQAVEADGRDASELVALVSDALQLSEVERLSAATYVGTWKRDSGAPARPATPRRQLKAVAAVDETAEPGPAGPATERRARAAGGSSRGRRAG